MQVLISETLTDSMIRLTGEEQKLVKNTAFDLQLNPTGAGMSFHKLDHARDKNFWSVRVSSDVRLIVHKKADSLLLCYAGHHDKAYAWAERRKLETHPKTGAAQLVEIRERVEEVIVPKYIEVEQPARPRRALFAGVADDELLEYGVPADWLADVRGCVRDDDLLALIDHLPAEASEALLELAGGKKPLKAKPTSPNTDPFAHPDAQRRFRVMSDVEELERALNSPWDKWTVFLHPTQRQLVERDYLGPARVAGSAGTGKTIVALHRAVFLARKHPDARILLATFSTALARALETRLRRLIYNEPRIAERLQVEALNAVGERLYERLFGRAQLAAPDQIRSYIAPELNTVKFNQAFLFSEWRDLADAWQLDSWESYRDVKRLGRKTRLTEQQRAGVWSVIKAIRAGLERDGLTTRAAMFTRLASHIAQNKRSPYDFIILDESQDVSVAQLKFLAALGQDRPDSLFFAGDLGQRIFQMPFSWKSLGVDVRGRSQTLRINYRTSHQIRAQADRLLGAEVSDIDGNTEERRGTISVFNGPAPVIQSFSTQQKEVEGVAAWLKEQVKNEIPPHEIGIFVRSEAELERAVQAASLFGAPHRVLDENIDILAGAVSICTMHLAKGLEFRAVAVMACDDRIIPLQSRMESIGDENDIEEIYNTERQLLYVACTRARDTLLVCGVEPLSEFAGDMVAA